MLAGFPLDRLMLEVTEHTSVDDYVQIAAALKPLRDSGLKLAVDDAGAGYASFRHILKLQPDVIKLDVSLIRQIDSDTGCRALAGALIRFAEETGSKIVAEGVETVEELRALRELQVNKAQGYLLGRPALIDALPSQPAWGDSPPAGRL
ncbi:EAL domain-containing protein [Paludibacterium sp.]|uniref:EAL domain-containing protein n=1 Tax=Paludibacterium sp. TaxID=1917523 RepID=UPI0025D6FC4F|nr:EAL domain-containing protein [Paludibacterium sp.]